MKRRTRSSEQTSKDIIKSPAFPLAGYKLFERLGVAVAASRGYSLSNVELARLMGQAASTAHYWFNVSPGPHVVSCFCLLEQLSRTNAIGLLTLFVGNFHPSIIPGWPMIQSPLER